MPCNPYHPSPSSASSSSLASLKIICSGALRFNKLIAASVLQRKKRGSFSKRSSPELLCLCVNLGPRWSQGTDLSSLVTDFLRRDPTIAILPDCALFGNFSALSHRRLEDFVGRKVGSSYDAACENSNDQKESGRYLLEIFSPVLLLIEDSVVVVFPYRR